MKKENVLVIALICIAVAGVMIYNTSRFGTQPDPGSDNASVQTEDGVSIAWQTYAQGMALAKEQDKQIFLYFHADWCTYCRKLKETTFKDTDVLSYLKENFISIAVDTDKDKALSDQWKVRGLPTLWFLKPDGSKIDSVPGYIDEKQFLQILNFIHTKSYDKMTFHEFVKTN